MLKRLILCGAVAALLAGTAPVLHAQAQGFMLDPTNSGSKTTGSSREAQPAYKGGVLVPYAAPNSQNSYTRPNYRQQEQKPPAPISYGVTKGRAGQAVSPGLYGTDVGLSPEEKAQNDRMARIKAHQAKRKAESSARNQAYNEKRAAEREAMLEAQKEADAYGNPDADVTGNRPLTRVR